MTMKDIEKAQENPERIPEGRTGSGTISLEAGLYIVATPIGNLRDMSVRALEVLRSVDVIYCEDTRVTKKLLHAYDVKTKVQVYHDHSDDKKRDAILDNVFSGRAVALVSDAGMPLISDPGYKLVKSCHDRDLKVTTVPGASAPLAAIQLSGLPSDCFSFLGFLPPKQVGRRKLLEQWASVPSTLVAFETAPRLKASLKDIESVLGNREMAVVREITKLYEEVKRGRVSELVDYYDEVGQPKGEIVLVIAPPEKRQASDDEVNTMLKDALETMKTKDAAAFVAEQTGRKKSDVYNMALNLGKS